MFNSVPLLGDAETMVLKMFNFVSLLGDTKTVILKVVDLQLSENYNFESL
jgi:hypothetical protein